MALDEYRHTIGLGVDSMVDIKQELEAQQRIQDMIASDAPLGEVLTAICKLVEHKLTGSICSIMLFDADTNTLSLAGGCFSSTYLEAMQSVPIGPEVGSCGTSAHLKKPIICEDIQQDPYWRDYRGIAAAENLRACWSVPVMSADDELLGTFATYYREPKTPADQDRKEITKAAALVAVAIGRYNDAKTLEATEQRYQSLFTHHPDAVFELDLDGLFRSGNASLTTISGFTEAELVGKHFEEFVDDRDKPLANAIFRSAARGEPRHDQLGAVNALGQHYDLEVTGFPIIHDSRVVGVYGVARDVTLRKRQEEELRLLMRGVEASINGVVMVDARAPDMPLVYVNKPFLDITGYSREEVIGRNCRFLQGSGTDPGALTEIRRALAEEREIQVSLLNYRKDGSPFWNKLFIAPVQNDQGRCTHYLGIQHDVSQHKAYEEQLDYHNTHDTLTGLLNRQQFSLRLQHDYDLCVRSGDLLAVLHVDLDGFKQVNEGLGHKIGDKLLIATACRLNRLITAGDTLARFSGDEFVVLLPRPDDEDQVIVKAEEILEALSEPFDIDGQHLHISGSIGIVSNKESVHKPDELVQLADLAKQEAKAQGRNTWQWYSRDEASPGSEQVALRRELNEALLQEQFELYYQPVVEAASGRIRSAEALIRWRHPQRGLVSPGDFIPLAEQTGQIIAIGRWVLRTACVNMIELLSVKPDVASIAVNISPVQFRRDGFLEDVRFILEETGLPADKLELEVTEGVLMTGADRAIETLNGLRQMNVQVAIDDFGTGFSSLSYLRQLPIQKVKIDRCFIQDVTTNRHDAAIVQGIITMAHHMNLVVVAEGIETSEQREDLTHRHCNLLQGYYFARPLPFTDLKHCLNSVLPASPISQP